ncbi:unnamed protein product [Blepharisma stoltei]|uniref:Uncharacterized protein n=1 Tax=Blepharisma stoltei TaxID=1481888 RepID=A0AAU9IV82_9CILI|nr:unnamed protein product [Blepharisma stoltei]
MEEKLSSGIEYGFLGMAVISSFTCLVRTDFNFAFSLLCYYLWHNANVKQDDKENIGKKLILLNVALAILDLIWLITMGSVWSSTPEKNQDLWDELSGIHSFALFLSWINWLIRAAIIGGLVYMFKEVVSNPKSLISGEAGYDMGSINPN